MIICHKNIKTSPSLLARLHGECRVLPVIMLTSVVLLFMVIGISSLRAQTDPNAPRTTVAGSKNAFTKVPEPSIFRDRVKLGLAKELQLAIVGVSVHEVYIEVGIETSFTKNQNTIILRNGFPIAKIPGLQRDTVLCDSGLTMNTIYTYQIFLKEGDRVILHTTPDSAHTLLPTSHKFEWHYYSFGGFQPSSFNDVSIANDSLACAVGEIYEKSDTSDRNVDFHNLEIWEDSSWKARCLQDSGRGLKGCYSLKAVQAGYVNDFWIAGDDLFQYRYQRNKFKRFVPSIAHGKINHLILRSAFPTIYGDSGLIGSYNYLHDANNPAYVKIESGTTGNIIDAMEVINPIDRAASLYCVVTGGPEKTESGILKIELGRHITANVSPLQKHITSLWANQATPVFASCKDGLLKRDAGAWRKVDIGKKISLMCVRGNALNDIFVCGLHGFLAHYDGENWKILKGTGAGDYTRLAVKGDFVIAVGHENGKAVALVGKRVKHLR
jgi:hypothetical protein